VFLNRYVAFRDFNIVYIELTYVLASGVDTVVDMWYNSGTGFTIIATVTLTAGSLTHQYVFGSPFHVHQGETLYPAVHAVPTGTGQDLTVSARGQYV
jgi:hypothetical protein